MTQKKALNSKILKSFIIGLKLKMTNATIAEAHKIC